MIYDIGIIGLGPAGISASIYSARGGAKTICFETKTIGGLLNTTNVINNYPGFINITGPEMATKMKEHLNTFDIDIKEEEVVDIVPGDVKKIITNKGEYSVKNIVIAIGRSRRSLNLENEEQFYGNGISYCALCDGHFFKGKSVAVVGGGDSSLEEAVYLSNIVKDVTIIVRTKILTGNNNLIKQVLEKDNIKIMYERNIVKLLSENNTLTGIELDGGELLDISGLFVYIGFDPVLPFKTELNLEKDRGYIVTDEHFKTSIDGIYAVGDIIKKDLYQIVSAVYEGAEAVSDILKKK